MSDSTANVKPIIFFFVKFFEQQSHADDFVAGRVFCNRLSKFKDSSNLKESGRHDIHEGLFALLQPSRGCIVINGMDMSNDVVGPIQIQKNWANHFLLFCMYAGHTGNLDHESLNDTNLLRNQLIIPDACSNLGSYAVMVNDVNAFVRRMNEATQKLRYGMGYRLVEYYDPTLFHGVFEDEDLIFRKQSQYKFQREFRFAINTHSIGDDPEMLDIGDLGDITWRFNSSDLKGGDWIKEFCLG